MGTKSLKYLLFALIVSGMSCKKASVNTTSEYLKWLSMPENGLVKTKYVNGMELSIKFLPAQYLAYLDVSTSEESSKKQSDSLLKLYSSSMSFRFSIGPDERSGNNGDIIYKGVADYKQYAQRSNTMNFDMESFITLSADGKQYRPVLSAMENTYGLDCKRSFIVVFAPSGEMGDQLNKAEKYDFVYSDEMFDLGVNHFLFYKEKIENIPAFPLAEINKNK